MTHLAPTSELDVKRGLLTRYFNHNFTQLGGILIYPCPTTIHKVTTMKLYNQLANFFTGVRLMKCGQSYKHFSKLISLPPHRIAGLEVGTIKPTLEDVIVFANYLGITVGDVFGTIEDENHILYTYVETGVEYNRQRQNRAIERALGTLGKLDAAEKRIVLKALNGE